MAMIRKAENGEEPQCIINGPFENLKIGTDVGFSRLSIPYFDCKGSEIHIGNHVSFASGVFVHTHTHAFNKSNWRELGDINNPEPTVIMEYAYIGTGVQILASCKYIGKHSVIGAGSTVTKDVPDYEIWAGNPSIKIGDVT